MTANEINQAIAEACGWTVGKPYMSHSGWQRDFGKPPFEIDSTWAGEPPPMEGCRINYDNCPNYVGSLDTMHDAWHTFGYDQRNTFEYELDRIVNAPFLANETVTVCPPTNATAAQRAEAFLRTVSKWKD